MLFRSGGQGAKAGGNAVKGHRPAWFPGVGEGGKAGFVQTTVFDRYAFGPGSEAVGPALFEERESTVVVPPGARARCDESLNLVIDLPG